MFRLKRYALAVCLALSSGAPMHAAGAAALPGEVWSHAADYSFMSLPDGLGGQWGYWGEHHEDGRLLIETNTYTAVFDSRYMRLEALAPVAQPVPVAEVLQHDPALRTEVNLLDCALLAGGSTFAAVGSAHNQLIESGNIFQRSYLEGVAYEAGAPAVKSAFEISAWPDRIALKLEAVAGRDIEDGGLQMVFKVPRNFAKKDAQPGVFLFLDEAQQGYLFQSGGDNEIQFDSATHSITVSTAQALWQSGHSQSAELIVFPVDAGSLGTALEQVLSGDALLSVSAVQILPVPQPLDVAYDPFNGWYEIGLRNDGAASVAETDPSRMEQVRITIRNSSAQPHKARLSFFKERPFGITGITAMLRDTDGYPLGLPLQISKNWHRQKDTRYRFDGSWYRGFSVVTIPAESELSFEYTSVNALWGGVPAASHSQLSLVGYGRDSASTQLWHQLALGASGETFCFQPYPTASPAGITDIRPIQVRPMDKSIFGNNIGGGNYLLYYDAGGRRQYLRAVRTQFDSYGPNLTSVTFTGISMDGKLRSTVSFGLPRTDDYARAVIRIRHDILQPLDFKRLAFFQVGDDDYNYTRERKFAYGNQDGLVEEWETWNTEGADGYKRRGVQAYGELPWVSMHDGINSVDRRNTGAPAHRGFVIRHWDARLGGVDALPYLSEYGATSRRVGGIKASSLEVGPPPALKRLEPGDFVEMELVFSVFPQQADDYFGPDAGFKTALEGAADTWRMIHREAVGNDLAVKMLSGAMLSTYPLRIRVNAEDEARFTVAGGVGHVPVTFEGLDSYRSYRLFVVRGGKRIAVDQSHHGNDFWQTTYNPQTAKWAITYNIPLGNEADEPLEFIFLQTDKPFAVQ